jgi:hypothetical protein
VVSGCPEAGLPFHGCGGRAPHSTLWRGPVPPASGRSPLPQSLTQSAYGPIIRTSLGTGQLQAYGGSADDDQHGDGSVALQVVGDRAPGGVGALYGGRVTGIRRRRWLFADQLGPHFLDSDDQPVLLVEAGPCFGGARSTARRLIWCCPPFAIVPRSWAHRCGSSRARRTARLCTRWVSPFRCALPPPRGPTASFVASTVLRCSRHAASRCRGFLHRNRAALAGNRRMRQSLQGLDRLSDLAEVAAQEHRRGSSAP